MTRQIITWLLSFVYLDQKLNIQKSQAEII